MEYQLGTFKILMNENRIISGDREQSVRPKTLELLTYFIKNQNSILSKQHLLDAVWQSAGAQEHVLFQSINEIRKLFSPLIVIKTHPRKGYQWLAEVSEIPGKTPLSTPVNPAPQKNNRWRSIPLNVLLSLVIVSILVVIYMLATAADNIKPDIHAPSRELVVLPIDYTPTGNKHGWVRLGGMDMIIQTLKSQPQLIVPDSEDVMMALARSNAFSETNIEVIARKMRAQLGEVVSLHTKLLGMPMEYQLHYSIMGRYHIKQGIVFADKIPALFAQLRQQVLIYYNDPLNNDKGAIRQQTADQNFLQAMESFYRQDFRNASHTFASLINAQPENITAQRFLLKSLTALKEYQRAELVGEQALAKAIANNDARNQLRTLFELGVLAGQQGQFERSQSLISASRELAQANGDNLYIAYAHSELGNIMMQGQHWQQAESLFQTALAYHQGFQCAYGQIYNISQLATLAQKQHRHALAMEHLDQALNIATENDLPFFSVQLLLEKSKLSADDTQRQQIALEAQRIVDASQDPQLIQHFQSLQKI